MRVKSLLKEFKPEKLVPSLTAGMIVGIIDVSFEISLAALIFSGVLVPYVAYGIGRITSYNVCYTKLLRATIAFGIRNFEKLNESLQQINRVLKKGGHLLILEMNEPEKGLLFKGYQLYTKVFVKMTSRLLSSDKKAYDYLQNSMHAFPNGEKLIRILSENGFKLSKYRKFTFGVCSMYLVEKV